MDCEGRSVLLSLHSPNQTCRFGGRDSERLRRKIPCYLGCPDVLHAEAVRSAFELGE